MEPLRIENFFGINNRYTDIAGDPREANHLENFIATDNSLEKISGSTIISSSKFTDSTGLIEKNIRGQYQTKLNGSTYRVAVGGDAIKSYSGGVFSDITGTTTITDDDDLKTKFATFLDGSANEIIIAANGTDAPIKWTGSGNAADLASAPGNFTDVIVHKNRLWACYDDYLVVSDEFDGETWDPLNVIRYINKGEKIKAIIPYSGGVCVLQETKISFVTGSNYRDFYNQEGIVIGDGCASGTSVQVVDSARWGNIVVFLSKKDRTIKGFNGSPNLIDIGLPAENLFKIMRRTRLPFAVSTVYDNKYYLGICNSGDNLNDKGFIYDFKRDNFTTTEEKPASAIYYMTGQNFCSMATWTNSDEDEIFVTSNYDADLVQQDYGLVWEDTTTIISYWNSKKYDFGSPKRVKMITDAVVVTEQETDSTLGITLNTKSQLGRSTVTIEVNGDLYDEALYDEALYGEATNSYTRTPFEKAEEDGQIYGRYFVYALTHATEEENLKINSIILGAEDLGDQQEYIEV